MVSKEAERHRERVTRRFDRAHDDLKKRIAFLEGELHKPLTVQAATGTLAAEVRDYFRGLSRPEREKLLREALAGDDDDATLQAVLGGQYFLSGLTKEDQAHLRELFFDSAVYSVNGESVSDRLRRNALLIQEHWIPSWS